MYSMYLKVACEEKKREIGEGRVEKCLKNDVTASGTGNNAGKTGR